ncbi:Integral membrane protein [Streptomyces ambofaciens ATCC 23877]|uniref:Integral membrane protein n=1 Tax=Streptomyces ambofaciens (strain ATCC 23877 / 3486 / DSM 40053 / JCM 4204 / NBRC 12836 / NRRL B-2516) TaxID=278992 RepID=A0A0K2B0F0_STRA7|nr:hypothetical protein [Streptomyces ambofaciens]AKZ58754.1 Integral membrane protein [Streptomyces ambofaciens ATCC 23877]
MSLGPQPWHGPPHHDERPAGAQGPAEHERRDAEEAARLAVGLRLGLRIAVVWLLYVVPAALAPAAYGTRVAGPLSLGVLLAVVPLAVGVHALMVYGRRIDRLEPQQDARRWS